MVAARASQPPPARTAQEVRFSQKFCMAWACAQHKARKNRIIIGGEKIEEGPGLLAGRRKGPMGAHGRGVRARKRSGAEGKDGGLEAALSLDDEKMQRQRGGGCSAPGRPLWGLCRCSRVRCGAADVCDI